MPVKEKSASSGVLSWLIAAAKIRSKNSSVQSGRRMWCSWAGHNFGALRNRDLTSELSGKDPLMLLSWNGCDRGRGVCSSNLSDVFIFLWCVSADSDRADHFGFRGRSNFLRDLKRQHFLRRKIRSDRNCERQEGAREGV